MKPVPRHRRAALLRTASISLIACSFSRGSELTVNDPVTDLVVSPEQTVWFDSNNTGTPIPLGTINGVAPEVGLLPGWAHTRYGYLKFDGTNVVERDASDIVVGPDNIASTNATTGYYDSLAPTTITSSRAIGLVETTRDFQIGENATLDVAMGGLLFHNNSHWVKRLGNGPSYITSASGRLVVTTNGGSSDYQINNVVIADPAQDTPLAFTKTGSDRLALSIDNTYTGGTRIHNGSLRANNSRAFGSGKVVVVGDNSQAHLRAGGNYPNDFDVEGDGWNDGGNVRGALQFGDQGTNTTSTIDGAVTLTGDTRIGISAGSTGILAGAFSGESALEINANAPEDLSGTLIIRGDAQGFTGDTVVARGRMVVESSFGGKVDVWGGATIGGSGTLLEGLEIGDSETPSTLEVNGAAGPLSIEGGVWIYGTTNLVATGFPAAPATSFTAFTYGSLTGDVSDLVPSGFRNATVNNDTANSRVTIQYTPGEIAWTGGANDVWTLNDDLNFDDNGPTRFYTGDHVTFGEDASQKNVHLSGPVYPGAVTFDHTSEYTLYANDGENTSGVGGSTGIVKKGSGTLLLGGFNTFTGPISIEAGVLRMQRGEAVGYNSGITVAEGAQFDLNGQMSVYTNRHHSLTIAGNGPDGLGAVTNSSPNAVNELGGVRNLALSGDASIGGNGGRFDIGYTSGVQGTVTGNGHTLTKVGSSPLGVRGDAGGSPIHFVIAEGFAWAENTDNAWGGETGTLTIKSGARAGTYGTRSIPTPVIIESGGQLYNEGGGTGTWTGPVTLSGSSTIAGGNPMVLTGLVSGTAHLTKTGGSTVTIQQPAWTGNTTVEGGILSLGQAGLDDDSVVSLTAESTLDLNFEGSDEVGGLVIDGVPQPAGNYDSNHPDHGARFTGNGVLVVTGEVSDDPYTAWEIANGVTGGPEADSDNDGILNAMEFALGTNPNANSLGDLPAASISEDGLYIDFVFRRSDASMTMPEGNRPRVEYGSDLSGWTTAVHDGTNVIITTDDDFHDVGVDRVTVRLLRSALSADGKLFVRLGIDLP